MIYLTTDEKLLHFQEFTMADAREQCNRLLDEYTASLEAVFEEHKQEKLRQSELIIKTETEGLERNKNKELSKQHLHIRRKITRKQNELKEKLFLEVKDLLLDYMKTADYENLLLTQIKEAVSFAKGQEMIIYIDPADASKQSDLESKTGAKLTVSEYSFLGGTRAIISARNILIDNSFESKLAERKENYTFDGGKKHD